MLHVARLASYFAADPQASFEDGVEAITSISKRKVLGLAITDLGHFPEVKPHEVTALEAARAGRNFIAHEGAGFGHIWSVRKKHLREHLVKLRRAVIDLAEGDNVVSRWVYEIEEKEPAPPHFSAIYPAVVIKWVFGDIPIDLLDRS